LYLRALAEFHKLTPETYRAAAQLLQQALEIDPSYLPAAGLIGWCRVRQRTGGVVTQEEIADAVRLGRRCLGSSREEPDALWMAGFTIALLAGEHALGLNAIERALALNPNCALAWMVCGWVQPLLNCADPAVASFERAMRLSPIDPLGYLSKTGLALAHACAGRHLDAMDWIDQSLRDQPGRTASLYLKVALRGLLDRADEAQQWVARLIKLIPDPTIARLESAVASFTPPQIRVGLTAGLRRSGVRYACVAFYWERSPALPQKATAFSTRPASA
jgi:adenylate cyclase